MDDLWLMDTLLRDMERAEDCMPINSARRPAPEPRDWFPIPIIKPPQAGALIMDGDRIKDCDGMVAASRYSTHSARFAIWYVNKFYPNWKTQGHALKTFRVANWLLVRCYDNGMPMLPYVAQHRHDCVVLGQTICRWAEHVKEEPVPGQEVF